MSRATALMQGCYFSSDDESERETDASLLDGLADALDEFSDGTRSATASVRTYARDSSVATATDASSAAGL